MAEQAESASAAATPKKRTRAELIRASVQLRIAANEDGSKIEALFKLNNVVFPVANWETVSPHWLVADCGGQVLGCLLVVMARPIGVLEFVLLDPTAKFKLRVIAMQNLAIAGATTLREYGCSYLSCVVPGENKAFMDVLKKYNFQPTTGATVLVKRLMD